MLLKKEWVNVGEKLGGQVGQCSRKITSLTSFCIKHIFVKDYMRGIIIAKLDKTVIPMLSGGLLNNGFVVITRGLLIPLFSPRFAR
jgi:hypothetical protein